jgi:phosphoenolpyruvate carboxykinase (ATP)
MLAEKVEKYQANVWLVNTGWSGGKHGIGKRMSLKVTRKIIDEIHNGNLEKAEYEVIPGFGFNVPVEIDGVDSYILNPVKSWKHRSLFEETSKRLAG